MSFADYSVDAFDYPEIIVQGTHLSHGQGKKFFFMPLSILKAAMFDKHRSHLQLQMDILEVIAVVRLEPYLITQIQQLTQMSTGQIKRYLLEMATKGLLTVELTPHARIARKEYKITANGMILMHLWQEFKKTWDMLLVAKPIDKLRNQQT